MKAVVFFIFSVLSRNAYTCETKVEYFGPMLSFLSENRQALGGFQHIALVENLSRVNDARAYEWVSQWPHQTFGLKKDIINITKANDTLLVIDMQDFQELASNEQGLFLNKPIFILAQNFQAEYFEGMDRPWRLDDRVFVFSSCNTKSGSLYEVYGVRKRPPV